ncbi:phosphatidate cytidylyltransferase [Sphingorhabdus soli]|uniref:Phosphatidate cytidylyltransferase n=1 Tax=Flavisphingopyxis soli TaxID=2601267 RepID=A0A5C6U7N2_9SPHN|nr:phosphatidate cytidylyltransferase [Sphingorhabdus soli]TXC68814.1 phosphatidate cytidylyltransferase [Sphingorhabdus soli]
MNDDAAKARTAKKSDLGVRAASAVVMIAVAGLAIWLGGLVFTAFAAAVALGVLWEWNRLAGKIAQSGVARVLWLLGGIVYVGVAVAALVLLREFDRGMLLVGSVIALVAAIDIGAYAAGRTFGGPKIAPSISPSKTWAGLIGAAIAASLVFIFILAPLVDTRFMRGLGVLVAGGIATAVIAQVGDFFESWMKRRAGVKDSSQLIPGHGGLFDRVDGLLAVLFVGVVVHLGMFL